MLRNGLLILNTLAVVACGYLVASTVRTLISSPPAAAVELPTPAQLEPPDRSSARYRAIGKRGLFRAGVEDEAPPLGSLEDDLVESELRVKLHGTVATGDSGSSVAVVEDQNTREKLFVRKGDELAGARVVSIEQGLIVIENKGQLEKISFDENEEAAPAPRRAPTKKGRGRGRGKGKGKRKASVSMADRIRLLKEVTEQNPAQPTRRRSILTQARIVPRYGEDGVLSGLQLSAIRPESLLEEAGFVNGDLVVNVNGTELSDPSQGLKVFRELESAESFVVDVERQGALVTLEYRAEDR